MTTPVTGATTIGATPGSVPSAAQVSSAQSAQATKSLLDPQAFLKLLVAQLRYQDPTSPMDSSQLMSQSATLSQVQAMSQMSSTLSSLAGAQQAGAATSLIGKHITYLDANGATQSGLVSAAQLASTGASLTVGSASVPLTGVLSVS